MSHNPEDHSLKQSLTSPLNSHQFQTYDYLNETHLGAFMHEGEREAAQ
jgi:hypothetical protein